ncbi:hypothetical protein [Microvirga ossetica]|uniref:hypothetical protein n=1 Tax=Microvirga ossetica TaxID=1882682 RepID=UPI0012FFF741|nr:hypothetical protein [Microvirga ossetica]
MKSLLKGMDGLEAPRQTEATMPLNIAAAKIKVRPGTLRTLLANEGKIRPEKRKGVYVPVRYDDAERLATDYADSVAFAGIEPILGVGRKIAMSLRDAGKLPVWIPGGKMGDKHRYIFRRKDIEGWVDGLMGDVVELDAVPEGCIALAETPLKIKVPTEVLVDAIKEGKVTPVGRLRGKPKFGGTIIKRTDAFAIRPEEITRKLSEKRGGARGPYKKRERKEG